MTLRPSHLGAALMIAAFLFFMPVYSHADCFQCVCATDSHCDDTGQCEPHTQNCTRQEFEASCTTEYAIRAETSCETSECSKCRSCVSLFKLDGQNEEYITGCHSVDCHVGDCDYLCFVDLDEGTTYVLYVCLGYCPIDIESSCTDCAEDCEAIGCLYPSFSSTGCTP